MKQLAERWGYATTPGFEGWEPARIAGELAALGYRHIEWTPDFCSAGDHIDRAVAALADATTAAGLEISQILAMADFVTGDDVQRQEAVDLTLRIIDAAADRGIGMVGIYAGPDSWDPEAPSLYDGIEAGEAWRRVFTALDSVLGHAEAQKVTLAFKPCVGTVANDYFASLPVIERFGASAAFAINYDPSHFALYGNDVAWTIGQLGAAIHHVELKDVFGTPGTEGRHFTFPLIGDGIVDWRRLFEALETVGYDGPMVALFETYGLHEQLLGGDPVSTAAITMDRLRLLEAALADRKEAAA
ncbi:MAG: hypothetical protein CMM46_07435 [Rhodospirillaceae bacterium]|nr:hypothetical protein [Rhodospirillaceae bacterium]|tara:strand:+ start:6709 stop:7611 length:903 start_codon:yes stop_codon:yes gene_type:complete